MDIKLNARCKALNLTVAEFSEIVCIPERTLQTWCKTKPRTVEVLLVGVRTIQMINEVNEVKK